MGSLPLPFTAAFLLISAAGVPQLLKGLSTLALERQTIRCRACGGALGRACTCGRD